MGNSTALGNPARTSPIPLQVLLDTTVALDQLLAREPWFGQAQPVW